MPIAHEDLNENLRLITISGRLDIQGTNEIETTFAAVACTENKRIIVDLTTVSFLASFGIRSLITNAKALQRRGGRMVLLVGDNNNVRKTLEVTGIDALLPMFSEMSEASTAALA